MPSSTRLPALDVLRGIAILGTLATNVWVFTNPAGLLGEFQGPPPLSQDGAWVEHVLRQLSTGKFLGLLSIMFGIGLAIQRRSALAAGRAWPGDYPWRAAILFVDGWLHFLLVAEFDVLTGYAVASLIVAWLLCLGPRGQRAWIAATLGFHLLLVGALALLALGAPAPPSDPAAYAATLDPNPYRDGSWWELVRFRIEHLALFRLEPMLIFAMTIGLFLLGARLFEAGVLEPSGAALRRRLIWIGALAWPVDMALGVAGGLPGLLLTRYGTAPLVALGLLGLVAGAYRARPAPGWLGRRLAEVGRTALSCYVLQNLLGTAVCYGWGLDLAGRIDESQRVPATVALYLALSAAVALLAHLWLRRFRRGPLEAAWAAGHRTLTRRGPA